MKSNQPVVRLLNGLLAACDRAAKRLTPMLVRASVNLVEFGRSLGEGKVNKRKLIATFLSVLAVACVATLATAKLVHSARIKREREWQARVEAQKEQEAEQHRQLMAERERTKRIRWENRLWEEVPFKLTLDPDLPDRFDGGGRWRNRVLAYMKNKHGTWERIFLRRYDSYDGMIEFAAKDLKIYYAREGEFRVTIAR